MAERRHVEERVRSAPAPARRAAERERLAASAPTAHPVALIRNAASDPGRLAPHQLLQLQRTVGNRATGLLLDAKGARGFRAKLVVGPAGDAFEQEADRVAREVMKNLDAPAHQDIAGLSPSSESAVGTGVRRQEHMSAQPDADFLVAAGGGEVGQELEEAIEGARGSGQSLEAGLRARMEQSFGRDFGGVRLHTDARADALNRSLQARAFTTGQDIFFRQGEYHAGDSAGQELIAHELAHVAQQGDGARRRPSGADGEAGGRTIRRVIQDTQGQDLWPSVQNLSGWKTLGEEAKLILVKEAAKSPPPAQTFNSATKAIEWARAQVKERSDEMEKVLYGEAKTRGKKNPPAKNFETYVGQVETLAIAEVNATAHPNKANLVTQIQTEAASAKAWAREMDLTSTLRHFELKQPSWQTHNVLTGLKLDEKFVKSLEAPGQLAKWLRSIWDIVSQAKGVSVGTVTVPKWGTLEHEGQGTWVDAWFYNHGKFPEGSSTDSATFGKSNNWEAKIKHSGMGQGGYTPLGRSTDYVRGHLLNSHIGGPALPYNLVAQTGSANQHYFSTVEEFTVNAVTEMYRQTSSGASPTRDTIKSVHLMVEAVWGDHGRAARNEVKQAADIVTNMKNNLEGSTVGKSKTTTVREVRDVLVAQMPEEWAAIHDAVNAVCPLELRTFMSIERLEKLMRFNSDLWAWEDLHVPLGIQGAVEIHYEGDVYSGQVSETDKRPFEIKNELPNVIARPLVKLDEIP